MTHTVRPGGDLTWWACEEPEKPLDFFSAVNNSCLGCLIKLKAHVLAHPYQYWDLRDDSASTITHFSVPTSVLLERLKNMIDRLPKEAQPIVEEM